MSQFKSEWHGDQIKSQVHTGLVGVLLENAQDVINSSLQIVPRQTSELADSAYTEVDPHNLIAIAGYDVPRDITSIRQHEDLTYMHPPGESAKFLEKPLRASHARADARIAHALRRVFR